MKKIRGVRLFIVFTALLACFCLFNAFSADADLAAGNTIQNRIRQQISYADSLIKEGSLGPAMQPADSAVVLARMQPDLDDTLFARALNVLGKLYFFNSDYGGCREAWQEALALRLRALGHDHELTAASLNNLGALAKTVGEFAKAESLYHEVLEIRLEVQRENHPDLAGLYTNLGSLKRIMGKFAEAESLYCRAYDINEKTLGINHPQTAGCINNIAVLYEEQGRYESAEEYYLRALGIRLEIFGENHPQTASSLNNLANLHYNLGHYGSAETLYTGALSIQENIYGENHMALTSILNNLAILYMEQGDYQKARTLLGKSLHIKESSFPENHPLLASTYDNLGTMYYNSGIYDTSLAYLEKALGIYENTYTDLHPYVISCRLNLAQLRAATGQYGPALDEYVRVNMKRRKFIDDVFAYASEKHKLKYLDKYPLINDKLIALALKLKSAESISAAGEMILTGKAAVIDAVCAEREAVSKLSGKAAAQSMAVYRSISREISTLVLAGADYVESDVYRRMIDSLFTAKDSLELELSRNFGGRDNVFPPGKFSLEELSRVLGVNSKLWEFVKFRDFNFELTGSEKARTGKYKYTAFILDHTGAKSLVDLGDAEPIDSLVELLRNMLYDTNDLLFTIGEEAAENKVKKVGRELYELVIEPLTKKSRDGDDIYISPDGSLNLLPFDILVTANGKYVIEEFKISYLSSGRDLPGFNMAKGLEGDVIIVADPDFSCLDDVHGQPGRRLSEGHAGDDKYYGNEIEMDFDCLEQKFQRLPFTGIEAERIRDILAGQKNNRISLHLKRDASEDFIKNLSGKPAVLHIASHGFFCGAQPGSMAGLYLQNPLLRSGMALAGANCAARLDGDIIVGPGEDGILTAFEASGLNLMGTDLVTLSACETGIGQIEVGEGVFGLRRAFQHAGAQSILMSLWRIQEQETCDLMEIFYRNWLAGLSKKDALHQAALEVMQMHESKYGSTHPYFWGGFMLLGNPD